MRERPVIGDDRPKTRAEAVRKSTARVARIRRALYQLSAMPERRLLRAIAFLDLDDLDCDLERIAVRRMVEVRR